MERVRRVETIGGAIAVQPLVPGFTITGQLSSDAIGSMWAALRTLDDQGLVLKIIPVSDLTEAQAQATQMMAVLDRIENEHLVRQHDAVALADGTLALVLDEVAGGSLAQLLGARGQLTPGETVTTVAPLFRALADLHAAGAVHGDLAPGSVVFSVDGRPLIGDLGVSRLLGRHTGPFDGTSGFVAPELVGGAAPSAASDVYAMAALGWSCLTGAPPASAVTRPSLTTLRSKTPPRLVEVLTSCLSADPAVRPSAAAAALEIFDAAPAESVALASASDPAADITRRIRVAAASAAPLAPPPTRKRYRDPLVIGVVALLVAVAFGVGATWFLRRPLIAAAPVSTSATPTASTASSSTPSTVAPATTPQSVTDVVMVPDSPRVAAAGLLQTLVDARALAYVARNSILLDLVYAPGSTQADVDEGKITTALKNGGTYLGLSFVIKGAAFLDGTSDTARIRAIILTPAYETGQPDGRKVSHAQETVGPCVFSLSLTRDGWRILGLTTP